VSIDAAYLAELRALMRRDRPQLPQLFVGGRLFGDADEVRLLRRATRMDLSGGMPCSLPATGGAPTQPAAPLARSSADCVRKK
jgi:hypothetical protein